MLYKGVTALIISCSAPALSNLTFFTSGHSSNCSLRFLTNGSGTALAFYDVLQPIKTS